MKKLIKSYKFWTTLAGAVGMFLTAISDFVGIKISAEGAKEVIMAFCGILIAVGIVKVPVKTETKEQNASINDLHSQEETIQDNINTTEEKTNN